MYIAIFVLLLSTVSLQSVPTLAQSSADHATGPVTRLTESTETSAESPALPEVLNEGPVDNLEHDHMSSETPMEESVSELQPEQPEGDHSGPDLQPEQGEPDLPPDQSRAQQTGAELPTEEVQEQSRESGASGEQETDQPEPDLPQEQHEADLPPEQPEAELPPEQTEPQQPRADSTQDNPQANVPPQLAEQDLQAEVPRAATNPEQPRAAEPIEEPRQDTPIEQPSTNVAIEPIVDEMRSPASNSPTPSGLEPVDEKPHANEPIERTEEKTESQKSRVEPTETNLSNEKADINVGTEKVGTLDRPEQPNLIETSEKLPTDQPRSSTPVEQPRQQVSPQTTSPSKPAEEVQLTALEPSPSPTTAPVPMTIQEPVPTPTPEPAPTPAPAPAPAPEPEPEPEPEPASTSEPASAPEPAPIPRLVPELKLAEQPPASEVLSNTRSNSSLDKSQVDEPKIDTRPELAESNLPVAVPPPPIVQPEQPKAPEPAVNDRQTKPVEQPRAEAPMEGPHASEPIEQNREMVQKPEVEPTQFIVSNEKSITNAGTEVDRAPVPTEQPSSTTSGEKLPTDQPRLSTPVEQPIGEVSQPSTEATRPILEEKPKSTAAPEEAPPAVPERQRPAEPVVEPVKVPTEQISHIPAIEQPRAVTPAQTISEEVTPATESPKENLSSEKPRANNQVEQPSTESIVALTASTGLVLLNKQNETETTPRWEPQNLQFDAETCGGKLGIPSAIVNMTVTRILNKLGDERCSRSMNLKLRPAVNKRIRNHVMEVSSMPLDLAALLSSGALKVEVKCRSRTVSNGVEDRESMGKKRLKLELLLVVDTKDEVLRSKWRHHPNLQIDDIPLQPPFKMVSGQRAIGTSSVSQRRTGAKCLKFKMENGDFHLDLLSLQTTLNLSVDLIKLNDLTYAVQNKLGGHIALTGLKVNRLYLDHKMQLSGPAAKSVGGGSANIQSAARLGRMFEGQTLPTVQILHDRNSHYRRNNWLLDLYGNWLRHEYKSQLGSLFQSSDLLNRLNACLID